jgi:phage terminase Nu1 subunit (DNA packaging protein)
MLVSYSKLTELTGKDYKTIRKRLEIAGIGIVSKTPGKATLWESVSALEAIYRSEASNKNPAECEIDFEKERARAEKERADKLELENAKSRGELINATAAGLAFEAVLGNFKTKLSGLPSRLSAMVDDTDERRRLFIESKAIVDESLIDLAKGLRDCIKESQ